MAIRRRRIDQGHARGRELVAIAARELLAARTNAGLSQAAVSAAVRISRPQYGRIERGLSPAVSVATLARLAAVLGLETSFRFYPSGDPVRDAAQVALLGRFRERCHQGLSWRTEVPFDRPGDRRAWDAVIGVPASIASGRLVRIGVEAETRPVDVQALDRKLALKERDDGVEHVILLLADTRHNRAFLRGPGASLRIRFPLDGRRVLELLRAGVSPETNGIVLL